MANAQDTTIFFFYYKNCPKYGTDIIIIFLFIYYIIKMAKNYAEMKNTKTNEDDVNAMLEGLDALPQGYYSYDPWYKQDTRIRDMIEQRLGIVNIDRLMKAAKAKQRYETQKTRDIDIIGAEIRTSLLTNTPYNGREGPIFTNELPDLSSGENKMMLREVASVVFNSSPVGDTIYTMADKVVVFCAWISDCNRDRSIYLTDDQIMSVINTVFKTHNILYDAYQRCFDRLNSLHEQVARRPDRTKHRLSTLPMEEFDGGFYKKNYRRSIKTKKSRKLRSRR